MDEADTAYGTKPILVLDVDGGARSVWLFEHALVTKLQEEVAKRTDGDFTLGERIEIERGAQKVTSSNGRAYWPYRVRFPDAPKRSAAMVLGTASTTVEVAPDGPPTADDDFDDSIPF